jgi:uncharacterized pyridoxal phosphate-containing UPF0001 family protein
MSSMPIERLQEVRRRIAAAARAGGRETAAVELIAVSKTFEGPEIVAVLLAGHRLFGENRVQEAKRKWPPLKTQFPDTKPKIAKAIAAEAARQGKRLQLFVQINTGEEPQKAGVSPNETGAFVAMCRDDLKLEISGLMCIPPVDEEPAVHFAFLAKIAGELGLTGLSMGMSDDFETAIEFGATHVRVGSAIFGMRATV